jgi:ABC-type uncharacterized transport system ATPase component
MQSLRQLYARLGDLGKANEMKKAIENPNSNVTNIDISKLKVGMKKSEVVALIGQPKRIEKTTLKNVISEHFIYDNVQIFIDNDIVTAIHESK